MLTGALMLVFNDVAAKWLLDRYDPLQITFARSVIALPFAALLVRISGEASGFRSRRVGIHALRGGLVLLATLAFFSSFRVLSLAEATALLFTAPIIVAIIAALFLGERVAGRRWMSIVLGFAGVLIILRPGVEAFRPEAAQALLAALLYALILVSARWVHPQDGLWTMTFYMSVFSVLFGAVSLGQDWPPLRVEDGVAFAAMAALGTGGAAFVSQAFRLAPASLVAPLDYTALIWASLAGWAIWGEVPGVAVCVGGGVIVLSGLLLLKSKA